MELLGIFGIQLKTHVYFFRINTLTDKQHQTNKNHNHENDEQFIFIDSIGSGGILHLL